MNAIMTDEQFSQQIENELYMRGYSDVQMIHADLGIRKAFAYITKKDGTRAKVRIIIPTCRSALRSHGFRVSEVVE